ncbi:hypothetical protein NQ317_016582, partial [Molorchus minor]
VAVVMLSIVSITLAEPPAPNNQYVPPSNQYIPPSNQYGAPRPFSVPSNNYGAPAQTQAVIRPNNQYGPPKTEYGPPGGTYLPLMEDTGVEMGTMTNRWVLARERLTPEYNGFATNNRVKLRWIPGHSGLEGNERADLLARLGSELGPVGPEPLVAISKATCAQSISKWVIQRHVEYWEKQELRQSRMKQTRTIIGVLTRHCPLQRHLYKMGLANNPTCRRCGEDEESALHVLCYCEGLARCKLRYLGQPFVEPEEIQKSPVNSLLGFEPANYQFQYHVQDAPSGNDFGHEEERQGGVARGKYFVLLPDGRLQTVEYTADQDGYKPKISYEQVSNGYGSGSPGGYSSGGPGGYQY